MEIKVSCGPGTRSRQICLPALPSLVCVCCGLLVCVCVRGSLSVCVWHHLLGQKSLLDNDDDDAGYQCHKLLEYADPVARRKRQRERKREEGVGVGEVRGRDKRGGKRRLMRH